MAQLDPPKISIVIAAYNCAGWIDQTIRSVLSQTEQDFELIVVDDGSKDDTEAIVKRAVTILAPDRFKWIKRQVGSGSPAIPRNQGLKEARGRWISFLDHDDLWLPERLKKTMDCFEQDPQLDWVCHDEYVVEGDLIHKRNRYGGKGFGRPSDLYLDLLIHGNRVSTSACLIRTEVVRDLSGFDESPARHLVEDFDLWVRMAKRGCRIKFLDEALGHYRIHPQNWTKNIEVNYQQERKYLEFCLARDPERLEPLRAKILGHLDYQYGRNYQKQGRFIEAALRFRNGREEGYWSPKLLVASFLNTLHVRV